jgi:hypothetical protein
MSIPRKAAAVYNSIIAKDAAVGSAVKLEGNERGYIVMPAAWTAADIGFKVCDTEDGTYSILRDTAGVAVDIEDPAVNIAHVLPDGVFAGTIWVKPWSKNATPATETDVTQAAARTIKFVVI